MLQIALCDDEALLLTQLRTMIEEYMEDKHIAFHTVSFLRGEQLLQDNRHFDLVFLDIKMAGMNGMETARILRQNGGDFMLVFVTALQDYVFDAFEVEAANYLLKPLSREKLCQVLAKAVKHVLEESKPYLTVCQGQRFDKLHFSEIQYCEAQNHSVWIYTVKGIFPYGGRIEQLEKELNENFFRCHRGYILNLAFLQSYHDNFAFLTSGEKLPVAKRRQTAFTKALLFWHRKEMR